MRNPRLVVRSCTRRTRRQDATHRNTSAADRVMWLVVWRALLSGMSIDPLTYFVLKFPAPVCHDCSLPMVTVTTIFHHATPDVMKVDSYQCQKCGCTLGAPGPRGGRNHVHRLPLAGWPPRI